MRIAIAVITVLAMSPVVGCTTPADGGQPASEPPPRSEQVASDSPAPADDDSPAFCNDVGDADDLHRRIASALRLFFRVIEQRGWWPPDEYPDLDTGLMLADVIRQASADLQQQHPGSGPISCRTVTIACQRAIEMAAGKLSWPLERDFKWGEPPQLLAASVEFVGRTDYVTPE